MTIEDILQQIPARRIKPIDGMSVTAEVWEEAHEYHRQNQRLHKMLAHGSGVVAGLDVIACDPPDSSVYILPGIAINPDGQTIVVPEPMTYDLGRKTSAGLFYLLLSYDEGAPKPDETRVYEESDPLYIETRFALEARRRLPKKPFIELARIRLDKPDAAISDAQTPFSPNFNEIDLRFRREIGAAPQTVASMAVCYAGHITEVKHTRGAKFLARALSHTEGYKVWVDHDVSLNTDLSSYTLVYLVGQDKFELNPDEMNTLYEYLKDGGTLLIESCRRETERGDPAADASFLDLLSSLGVTLNTLSSTDNLLTDPYVFATPPPGFETRGQPGIQIGGGVVFSTFDYGCLWQGERRQGEASREEIRAAMEWGANIIAYALARQGRR